jgi:spore germination protein KC
LKKLLLVFLCFIILAGCWDRTELNRIGIVSAIAIDRDPDTGEFIFTSQILKPAALSTQTPSPETPFEVISISSKTIMKAIRKTNQTFDRQGFYAHNKVIIISEQLAKEGLMPVLDSFQRGKEIRGYVWVCIAKDVEARKILEMKTEGIDPIPANYLKNLIDNTKNDFNATSINMLRYYRQTLAGGNDPVVGVLNIEKKENAPSEKQVKISGGAVFSKDKLKGFLNEKETNGYRWVTGNINAGAIVLPSLLEEGEFVTITVDDAKAKVIPKVDGDRISFTIEVKEDGALNEQQATGKFSDRQEIANYLKELEKQNKKLIEEEIHLALEAAQRNYEADILGFGRALNKDYPEKWNEVKENWNEVFSNVPYTLKVDVELTNSGLMQGPFKPS